MTIQDDHAVVTFKKTAKDQDAPVRLLQGPKTQMADPHGLRLTEDGPHLRHELGHVPRASV